jgi:predicted TIM-barrel fold metal-dependent hydrolase
VGVEWLALLYSRLDHFWPYLTEEAPFLAPRPSEVLRQHVHVTTHSFMSAHPRVLAAQIEAVGVGNVVFGTNWPHFDAGSPADVRRLGLNPGDEQRILGGTAQALFRLLPLPVAR